MLHLLLRPMRLGQLKNKPGATVSLTASLETAADRAVSHRCSQQHCSNSQECKRPMCTSYEWMKSQCPSADGKGSITLTRETTQMNLANITHGMEQKGGRKEDSLSPPYLSVSLFLFPCPSHFSSPFLSLSLCLLRLGHSSALRLDHMSWALLGPRLQTLHCWPLGLRLADHRLWDLSASMVTRANFLQN